VGVLNPYPPDIASAPGPAISVRLLGPGDVGLAGRLADLVNVVYEVSEAGLWRDGTQRTDADEMGVFITAGEIAVATIGDEVVGSVRVHDVADDASEFGILAGDPERRGVGIGTALIGFAEAGSRDRGMRAMQLELLVPREFDHPSKVFLDAWYGRIGYRVIDKRTVEQAHPELKPLLATPCDFLLYEKPLR
jgi:GNAT superfamily N-acetyltransferase